MSTDLRQLRYEGTETTNAPASPALDYRQAQQLASKLAAARQTAPVVLWVVLALPALALVLAQPVLGVLSALAVLYRGRPSFVALWFFQKASYDLDGLVCTLRRVTVKRGSRTYIVGNVLRAAVDSFGPVLQARVSAGAVEVRHLPRSRALITIRRHPALTETLTPTETVRSTNPIERLLTALVRHNMIKVPLRTGSAFVAPHKATPAPARAPQAPILLGLNTDGEPIHLAAGNLLCGGLPNFGKSVLIRGLVCQLSPRADVQFAGIDLKGGVELSPFDRRFSFVAKTTMEALQLLHELRRIIAARLADLQATGEVQHVPSVDSPEIWLIIDELGELLNGPDRDENHAVLQVLTSVLRLGRACSIRCVGANQMLNVDSVPSPVRGLFHSRLSFCQAGEELLRAALGIHADRLQLDSPGRFFLMAPGYMDPVLGRSFMYGLEHVSAAMAAHGHLGCHLPGLAPQTLTPPAVTPESVPTGRTTTEPEAAPTDTHNDSPALSGASGLSVDEVKARNHATALRLLDVIETADTVDEACRRADINVDHFGAVTGHLVRLGLLTWDGTRYSRPGLRLVPPLPTVDPVEPAPVIDPSRLGPNVRIDDAELLSQCLILLADGPLTARELSKELRRGRERIERVLTTAPVTFEPPYYFLRNANDDRLEGRAERPAVSGPGEANGGPLAGGLAGVRS